MFRGRRRRCLQTSVVLYRVSRYRGRRLSESLYVHTTLFVAIWALGDSLSNFVRPPTRPTRKPHRWLRRSGMAQSGGGLYIPLSSEDRSPVGRERRISAFYKVASLLIHERSRVFLGCLQGTWVPRFSRRSSSAAPAQPLLSGLSNGARAKGHISLVRVYVRACPTSLPSTNCQR